MRGDRRVPAPALRGLAHSLERAAERRERGRILTDIALARLMLAEHDGPARREDNLALAEAALAKGLGMAPMHPYGWMRLVQLRTIRGAPAPEVAAALRLALRSGPHENRRDALLLLSLEAGLRGWGQLDARQRGLIAGRAREAWRRDPAAAAAAAVRVGETARLARLLGFPT